MQTKSPTVCEKAGDETRTRIIFLEEICPDPLDDTSV